MRKRKREGEEGRRRGRKGGREREASKGPGRAQRGGGRASPFGSLVSFKIGVLEGPLFFFVILKNLIEVGNALVDFT